MNTHNVKTAAPESSERWGETIVRVLDEAHCNVACTEEANAHYGERFTRLDACVSFIRGAVVALFRQS
ncbi:hypothetical protein [Buttiauxella ferragutiae]|uniref:hypothetical protein n=1 Tax=Buttiauxella ferragutiae TaxID=82989 RepID=UPI003524C3D5